LDALFSKEIRARVTKWLDLAAERLDGTGVPLVLIPGNDDPYDIDEPLAASQYCTKPDGAGVGIPGALQVIGLGKSWPTPWPTPAGGLRGCLPRGDRLPCRSGQGSQPDDLLDPLPALWVGPGHGAGSRPEPPAPGIGG